MKQFIEKGMLYVLIYSMISCGGAATPVFDKTYTTASNGSVNSYTVKPLYDGENTSAVYASGTLDLSQHNQFRQTKADKKTLGSIDVYKSFTRKWWNFFYGGSAAYGTFTFKGEELGVNNDVTIVALDEKLDFYNLGFKAGVSFKVSTSKFEFRPVGLKVLYNYEFGSYRDKLEEIDNIQLSDRNDNYKVYNENPFLTVLVEKEILYKINSNNSLGLGVFSGINSIKNYSSEIFGIMANYRFKRVVFSYMLQSTFIDVQFDEVKRVDSHKIGITYQLF